MPCMSIFHTRAHAHIPLSLSLSFSHRHSLIRQVASSLSLKMNCMHDDVTSVSFCRGAKYWKSRVILLTTLFCEFCMVRRTSNFEKAETGCYFPRPKPRSPTSEWPRKTFKWKTLPNQTVVSRLETIFLNVGPFKESIFLTNFYCLYFSHQYTSITN